MNLTKPILIHVCKDRTLSYRNRRQPIFNEVALPVHSVADVNTARKLIKLVGERQYTEHPLIPGDAWYKLPLGPALLYLETTDLPACTAKLEQYEALLC